MAPKWPPINAIEPVYGDFRDWMRRRGRGASFLYPSPSRWRRDKIADERHMVAKLEPIGVQANGDINAVWIKGLAGEHVVYMVTLIRVMIKIKGFIGLLAVFASALAMVKAMESGPFKQGNELTKLVPP